MKTAHSEAALIAKANNNKLFMSGGQEPDQVALVENFKISERIDR